MRVNVTPSSSSLFVTGDDQSVSMPRSSGKYQYRAASGACVEVIVARHSQMYCWSYETATLFLGVACHVRRSCASRHVVSFDDWCARSGTYTHAFGLFAFRFGNAPPAKSPEPL